MVGSISNLLDSFEGSIMGVGGSIGDLVGQGIGSVADGLQPVLDGLATASRQGEGGGGK